MTSRQRPAKVGGTPLRLVITIDGPAGAGKTTVAKMLAQRLGYRYLDTGALYRAVALAVRRDQVPPEDDRELAALLERIHIALDGGRVILDGVDLGERIRTPEITMLASDVSARPVVRRALLDFQRDIGKGGAVVAEGRDMGTVVFPHADLKFYLDAGVRQRALRRFAQYGPDGGQTIERIEADIRRRDANDSRRDIAPLQAAEDAVRIDSSALSAESVVERMMERIHRLEQKRST